jgi:hypothetical protein
MSLASFSKSAGAKTGENVKELFGEIEMVVEASLSDIMTLFAFVEEAE